MSTDVSSSFFVWLSCLVAFCLSVSLSRVRFPLSSSVRIHHIIIHVIERLQNEIELNDRMKRAPESRVCPSCPIFSPRVHGMAYSYTQQGQLHLGGTHLRSHTPPLRARSDMRCLAGARSWRLCSLAFATRCQTHERQSLTAVEADAFPRSLLLLHRVFEIAALDPFAHERDRGEMQAALRDVVVSLVWTVYACKRATCWRIVLCQAHCRIALFCVHALGRANCALLQTIRDANGKPVGGPTRSGSGGLDAYGADDLLGAYGSQPSSPVKTKPSAYPTAAPHRPDVHRSKSNGGGGERERTPSKKKDKSDMPLDVIDRLDISGLYGGGGTCFLLVKRLRTFTDN